MRGTGWEHEETCWKRAPHSPCLLKIARLSTERGHRTNGWQGRQGHCRQLDQRVSDYRARAGEQGGAERGPPAGGEAKEKACPRPPNTHTCAVTCTLTHTHPRIHTFKNTFIHILSSIHNAPMNTLTHTLIQSHPHSRTHTYTHTDTRIHLHSSYTHAH